MSPDFTLAGDSRSEPRQIAAPEFLVSWEKRQSVFFENLAEFFRPRHHKFVKPPGAFWNNVLIPEHSRARGLTSSLAIHAALIGILILTRDVPLQGVRVESPLRHAIITRYSVSDFLPALREAEPAAATPKSQAANAVHPSTVDEKPDPVLAHQEVLSVAPEPEGTRQTVVTPVPVRLPRVAPLPNLIAVTRKPLLEAPPPILEPARTSKNFHATAEPADIEAPTLNLPANLPPMSLPQNADMPEAPNSTRVGELDIARPPVLAPAPKLPVPEQTTVPPTQSSAPKPGTAPEPLPQARSDPDSLLALSTKPAEIRGPIDVPLGVQRDEFATSPAGKADASGAPGRPAAKETEPPPTETVLAKASPLAAPVAPAASLGVVVASKPSFRDIMAASRAEITRPNVGNMSIQQPGLHPEPDSVDASIFGEGTYRSMIVSLPNLASAAGTWEIHFAEFQPQPDTGELQPPMPLSETDPAYPADLIHDQVEGVVVLYAVIQTDGSVGKIRVLQGVNSRLDASAVAALAKWHFAPAMKNGQRIPLQAVVKVPFRARRLDR
jgi:protein TonB